MTDRQIRASYAAAIAGGRIAPTEIVIVRAERGSKHRASALFGLAPTEERWAVHAQELGAVARTAGAHAHALARIALARGELPIISFTSDGRVEFRTVERPRAE